MARFDLLLVAPSDSRLVEAIGEAARAAHEGVTAFVTPRHPWEGFLAEFRSRSEGRRQWSDSIRGTAIRFGVDWWTDHVGRRHVRVYAGNSRDPHYHTLSSTRTDRRSALWHVYPERVFFRVQGGQGAWIAVCGCGVAGPPARIGWMGTSCGPCHDRAQEGESVPCTTRTGRFWHHAQFLRPLFSPDGRLFATLQAPTADTCHLRVYDLNDDSDMDFELRRNEPSAVAFSPDGRFLASAGQFVYYPDNRHRLLVRDLAVAPYGTLIDVQTMQPVHQMCFTPSGDALVIGGPDGVFHCDLARGTEGWAPRLLLSSPCTALALSPDGGRLAVGGPEGLSVYALIQSEAVTVWHSAPVEHRDCTQVVFSSSRDEVLSIHRPDQHLIWRTVAPGPPSLLRVHNGQGKETGCAVLSTVSESVLSPGGKLLAGATREPGRVGILRPPSPDPVAEVGWDLEAAVAHVSLSPDGQTLAVVSERGVGKLIPYRLLLEAGPPS